MRVLYPYIYILLLLAIKESPFARPSVLLRLGQYIMDVKRSKTCDEPWTGSRALPLILLAEKKSTYLVIGISPTVSNIISDENYYSKKIQRGSADEQEEERRKQSSKLKILTNFGELFKSVVNKIRRTNKREYNIPDESNMHYFYPGFDTQAIEIQKEYMEEFVQELNDATKYALSFVSAL